MKDILEEYQKYLRGRYRNQNTRKNNYKFAKLFLDWIEEDKGKTYNKITKEDTKDYKAYCLETYKVNGNVARLNGINNFLDDFLKRPELRVTVPRPVTVNKQILSKEDLKRYIESAETALEKLIVRYQVDAFLRPNEFAKLRISLHDLKNQIVYLDDTKTGNNSVIFTPNMIKVYEEYLMDRLKPEDPKYNDHLIIIDKGSHYGKPITSKRADFIWRHTKKIAARAGFERSVYPYLIKPSAITDGFNKKVNPKILQRQARHSRIETTLMYDHTSDEMVKEYFNKAQRHKNTENLKPEDKAKVWLDKLLSNEIDLKTFKTGLDVLLPKKHKGDDIGYV
jgi:integrase/recombinase XerD